MLLPACGSAGLCGLFPGFEVVLFVSNPANDAQGVSLEASKDVEKTATVGRGTHPKH